MSTVNKDRIVIGQATLLDHMEYIVHGSVLYTVETDDMFDRAEKPRARKPSVQVMEEEVLMQALAEAAEDNCPDDGAIEIDSDEEYRE
ncbi:hypothetical protein B0H10DRAFT_2206226 [Mycena sp. CBHHK59/15]|nr:hypothetical protein B0H10DRAFT_2206226 [Mycena sp. CBHHK59/15]